MSIEELQAENARLKAEVEAHEKRWAESEDLISHYKQQRDEAINDCKCSRLKAEVERLKQEKNELAVMIHPVALKAWMNLNAAKEGKKS